MVAVAFTFPAGRYHATPWDRHVNEGAVAWPPEPWRILRSLIATWHHKVEHGGKHAEATLLELVESLAETLPEYRLPAASHSHTRHYMPQFKVGDTSLVFDAFAAVGPDDPLTVSWPGVTLSAEQASLLDELLAVMGYLGRTESWVEARRIEVPPPSNCRPGDETFNATTGEVLGELVTLIAPLPTAEYRSLRDRFLSDKKAARKLGRTLPDNMLAALSLDSSELRRQGWNRPPAARSVTYVRAPDSLRPTRVVHRAPPLPATTAQFVLAGKPLPRVEDSLRIGELFRAAVMGQAKRRYGQERIPVIFSGHGLPAGNRHGHAFYLPWDSDGDGCIDRVLLHVPLGMDAEQRRVVEALDRLWSRDGGQWRVALEGIGNAGFPLLCTSRQWRSLTPYLHPWHCKKGFAIEDQIRRECRERGLPEPVALERQPTVAVAAQARRSIQFYRFRSRQQSHQPDRLGSFWCLTFAEPVAGPMALGFACHYGLGLFAPA